MDPTDAFKAMGEFWGRGAQSFLDAQRSFFSATSPAGPSMAGVAPAVPDLQAVQASQAGFEQAWSAAQAVSRAFAGGLDGSKAGKSDPVAADVLAKIFDPSGWLTATNPLDENLTRMAEGPRLADLWNIERRFGSVFTAWTALRRRNLEHGTVMLEAWTKATGEFSKVVNERAQAGKPLDSPREMMALWVEIANDVLLETQRSEAFLKSQRETLKASTDLRLAQQELAEFYAEMFGYPTRAELDDVHRSLTELRREVRSPARTAARAKPSGKKAKVASR